MACVENRQSLRYGRWNQIMVESHPPDDPASGLRPLRGTFVDRRWEQNPGNHRIACIPSSWVRKALRPVLPSVFVHYRIGCPPPQLGLLFWDGEGHTKRDDFQHEQFPSATHCVPCSPDCRKDGNPELWPSPTSDRRYLYTYRTDRVAPRYHQENTVYCPYSIGSDREDQAQLLGQLGIEFRLAHRPVILAYFHGLLPARMWVFSGGREPLDVSIPV